MAETGRSTRVRQQVEKWRDELLDLTGRNKLLRFRPSKMTLEIELPRPQVLVDRLMTGRSRYWSVFLPADGMLGEETSEAESESVYAEAAAAGSDPGIPRVHAEGDLERGSVGMRPPGTSLQTGIHGPGCLDPLPGDRHAAVVRSAHRSETELDSPLLLFPVDLVAEKGREGWRDRAAENEVVVDPRRWL